MRSFHLRCVTAAVCVLTLVGVGRADEKKYNVKLARPAHVGDRYDVTIDGAMLQEVNSRFGDEESAYSENGYGIHLEGTVKVLAVNNDGEESKIACTVKKCVRIAADGEKELIAEGRVVTAEAGKGKTTFTLDQGDLPENGDETLDLALRLPDADGDNDDTLYGTKEPQPVGGQWAVNSEAVAANAKKDDVQMEAKDVKGTLTLAGIEKFNDIDCLKIKGSVGMMKFTPPTPKDLPNRFKSEPGTMEMRFTGLYPVDGKTGSVSEAVSLNMTGALRRAPGDGEVEAVVRTKTQRSVEMKRRFLPAESADDKEKTDDK